MADRMEKMPTKQGKAYEQDSQAVPFIARLPLQEHAATQWKVGPTVIAQGILYVLPNPKHSFTKENVCILPSNVLVSVLWGQG